MADRMGIDDCPYVAPALLAHELLFIRRFLEMHNLGVDSTPVIAIAMTPFLSMIAFETDQWIRHINTGETKDHNDWVRALRQQFKGLASTGLTVQSYNTQCDEVVLRSSKLLRSSIKPAILRPLCKDFGVHVLDGIEVASTLGVSRLLLRHRDSMTSFQKSVPGMDETSTSLGLLLGEHLQRLDGLLAETSINDLRPYTYPEVSITRYDYYLKQYLSVINENFSGFVPSSVLFTISDAYYELGIIEVLLKRGIIDMVLATKLRLITLYEFETAASKISRFAHSDNHSFPLETSVSNKLTSLLERKERKYIERCKDVRNVLVHYGPLPKIEAVADIEQSFSYGKALDSIASPSGKTWERMQVDILNIAESFRSRSKQLIGIRLSGDDEEKAKKNG